MNDEELEERMDHSFKLGVSVGWESAGHELRELAVNAFRRRDDEVAVILRQIASDLESKSEKLHPGPGR